MPKRMLIFSAAWTLAFLVAVSLDARIAEFSHTSGLAHAVAGTKLAAVLKFPGTFWFTLLVAPLLWLFRRAGWKCSAFVILAGIVSSINGLVKWITGRMRPYKIPGTDELRPFEFHPFWHGMQGFFHQKDLSFPSGHECTAAALAAAIFIVWPRGAWVFIVLAVLVGIERISENAHYLSDVVAAAGLSMLCVGVLDRLLSGWMTMSRPRGFPVAIAPMPVESGTLGA